MFVTIFTVGIFSATIIIFTFFVKVVVVRYPGKNLVTVHLRLFFSHNFLCDYFFGKNMVMRLFFKPGFCCDYFFVNPGNATIFRTDKSPRLFFFTKNRRAAGLQPIVATIKKSSKIQK